MELQMFFNIVLVVLMLIVIVLLLIGKHKSDISEIVAMLKRNSDEQRDSVAKQISDGATEQFKRFGFIQESVQQTLITSREEQGKQMHEFKSQIDNRLSEIQRNSIESNEKLNTSITATLQSSRTETNEQLGKFSVQLDTRLSSIQEQTQRTLQTNREEQGKQIHEFQSQIDSKLSEIQKSSTDSNDKLNINVTTTLQASRTETNEQLGKFSIQLDTRLSSIQEQTQKTLQASREETNKQLREFGEQVDSRLSSIQRGNTENIEKVNTTLENKMKSLQESNEKRLESIQTVVDEKLQKTLEARLTQSFELVSKQLDSVQQGLGEMKNLAADARSLKNALTNVKERGTYGEVRLEKLLSDILTPNQYEMNVEINNNKRVEFAIKLPGNGDAPLLLPIDSKFPIEDYNRLLDAEDKPAIEEARKSLTQKIRVFAKDIYDKYIFPPKTTDFALMFLPTEGLYAEVVQNAALFEELRDKYKVTAVGATTISAFLSSLQMGFKTLAIEQRSQEVWNTLRSVKSEFIKFGDMLDKAHKQIQTADKTLEEIVGKRTRAINKTLRTVDELNENESPDLIETEKVDDDEY